MSYKYSYMVFLVFIILAPSIAPSKMLLLLSSIALSILLTTVSAEIRMTCPPGTIQSTSDKSTCFLFNNTATVFKDAEFICQTKGGHLAQVTNQFTNTFLTYTARSSFPDSSFFWIGAHVQKVSTFNLWTWTMHDSVLNYTDWAVPPQTNTMPSLGRCAASNITDGTWSSEGCLTAFPFVCQLPAVINEYSCQSGWTYFEGTGSCYKVFPQINIVQDDADRNCRNQGANLISIHSDSENDFLAEMTSIKYHENYAQIGIWIGLYRNGDDWYWTDGTRVDYTNWGKDDPDSGDCVLYYPDGCDGWDCDNYIRQWDTYRCDVTPSRYACKKLPSMTPFSMPMQVNQQSIDSDKSF